MARKKKEEEKKDEPPITTGEPSAKNPSGIEAVSEQHAQHLGQLRGHGGPGAAGATVAGPAVHVATEGGTKPLPVRDLPEGVETTGGAEAGDDQPTSQAAAAESGDPENTGGDDKAPAGADEGGASSDE